MYGWKYVSLRPSVFFASAFALAMAFACCSLAVSLLKWPSFDSDGKIQPLSGSPADVCRALTASYTALTIGRIRLAAFVLPSATCISRCSRLDGYSPSEARKPLLDAFLCHG